MRRILLVPLFLAVIGFASAISVLVTVSLPGTITVLNNPGFSASITSLAFPDTLAGQSSTPVSFTLTNTGNIALTIDYSCTCPAGLTLVLMVLGQPLVATPLAIGGIITVSAVMSVAPTVTGGSKPFTLVLTGSG